MTDSRNSDGTHDPRGITRRALAAAGLGLAAIASTRGNASSSPGRPATFLAPGAPFDSLRDYVAALESAGLVLRFPRIDQDAFEGTAIAYQVRDTQGMLTSPTLIFEEVRIDGQWVKGPVIVNESSHLMAECLAFGLPANRIDPIANFYTARDHWERLVAGNNGRAPMIEPVEVPSDQAPCKEIVLTGDEIDLTRFAFIKCNPADIGRYINTGMCFIRDEEVGINFGTYRCHLRGPRELGFNPEPLQTGWRQLMAARKRGEKTARVSIALSGDPAVWLVSGNKLRGNGRSENPELAIAGGIRGRPLEVVRSETNDLLVPAHAEMIIEGEIPLDDLRPEGPYGEMVGYQGPRKEEAFWIRVTAVTHRPNPWIMNNFTGVTRGTLIGPSTGLAMHALRKKIPAVTDFFSDRDAVGLSIASIRKTEPGQGLEVAKKIAETNFFAKIVVVVDEDVAVTSKEEVLSAMGARWQPAGAVHVYESLPGLPIDPSAPKEGRTSKIAIDATRRWPEEGGPESFPPFNRTQLEEGAPDSFALAEKNWGEVIRSWRA